MIGAIFTELSPLSQFRVKMPGINEVPEGSGAPGLKLRLWTPPNTKRIEEQMSMNGRHILILAGVMFLAASCSESTPAQVDQGNGNEKEDMGVKKDVTALNEQGIPTPQLPAVPTQSGVAYLAHYDGPMLQYFRTDGDHPTEEGSLDLGADTHNLELDPYNDLLFAVSHMAKTITIFKLSRPSGPSDPVVAPEELAVIETPLLPMFAKVNPHKKRLYVVAAKDDGSVESTFSLLAYNIEDPAQPSELSGSPFTIEATSALAIDAPREVLFVVGLVTDKLHIYDLHGDTLTALPGDPVALLDLFPQESESLFQARSLVTDPFRNRLYAARAQALFSELIIFEYPADLPTASAGYGEMASHSDLTLIDDPFDVDLGMDDRPHILDAHTPAVDYERGGVMLSTSTYSEYTATGLLTAIKPDMSLGVGCDAFEGFGCWIRQYSGTEAGAYIGTGGALCVDYTHKVVVTTGLDPDRDSSIGYLQMFQYEDDMSMTPILPAEGGNLQTGRRVISAVCH